MKFTLAPLSSDLNQLSYDLLIVGVFEGAGFAPSIDALKRQATLLKRHRAGDIATGFKQCTLLHDIESLPRVLCVGLGPARILTSAELSELHHTIATQLNQPYTKVGLALPYQLLCGFKKNSDAANWAAVCRQWITDTHSAHYYFDHTKAESKKKTTPRPKAYAWLLPEDILKITSAQLQRALVEGDAIGNGAALTRDLGNLAPNFCTPTYLARQAQQLAQHLPLKVEVLGEKKIAALKMNAFLAVAKGSVEPPQLITLNYQGAGKAPPIVLVGKGITFDSGGISLKPGLNMDEMKYDMSGAGTVLGVMRALAQMKLKLNVIGVIPTCENMPSSRATKPGDIVTSMSGQTIEILNTDAEGRLILCDALTFCERFQPAAVIDIATLTGACVVALGHHHSGLFSPVDALANDLLAAGNRVNDTVWRMPLDEAYQKQLDSNFADIANIGGPPAGSVTAACFLQRFTRAYPWAHLDIAGTAWTSGKNKGATGRPVKLLCEYLRSQSA